MRKNIAFWALLFLLIRPGTSLSPELAADTGTLQTEQEKAAASTDLSYTPEQEYLFELFHKRRSVRKFKPTPVPREHLLKILDMARSAPTSGNQQPWKFLVVQDPVKLAAIRDACIEASLARAKKRPGMDAEQLEKLRQRQTRYFTDYLSAPVYVVVLVDSRLAAGIGNQPLNQRSLYKDACIVGRAHDGLPQPLCVQRQHLEAVRLDRAPQRCRHQGGVKVGAHGEDHVAVGSVQQALQRLLEGHDLVLAG